MTYYRIALKSSSTNQWRWHTTALTSFNALFWFINVYDSIGHDRIRFFFASTPEKLDKMLKRHNEGQASSSISVEQLLSGKIVSEADIKRLEWELSTGDDDDKPYIPPSISAVELAAWTRLKEQIQRGELIS